MLKYGGQHIVSLSLGGYIGIVFTSGQRYLNCGVECVADGGAGQWHHLAVYDMKQFSLAPIDVVRVGRHVGVVDFLVPSVLLESRVAETTESGAVLIIGAIVDTTCGRGACAVPYTVKGQYFYTEDLIFKLSGYGLESCSLIAGEGRGCSVAESEVGPDCNEFRTTPAVCFVR